MTAAIRKLTAPFARGRIWAWVPVFLLGGLIGTQLAVLHHVLEDPSFALEPDYYRKAVDWDARRQRERESQALGWRAQLQVTSGAPRSSLRVQLSDALGQPLVGADLRVRAFANARAARQLELTLAETAPGAYEGELPVATSGLWEFRLQAQRGDAHFEQTVRQSLAHGRASP